MADDELRLLDTDLGELVESFVPAWANPIAAFLIGLPTTAGGAALVWVAVAAAHDAGWQLPPHAKPGWSWLAVGGVSLVGAAITVGGAALVAYARWLVAHRVDICVGGFRYAGLRSSVEVRWADVASIRETITHDSIPIPLHILHTASELFGPKFVNRSYTALTTSGREYLFNGDSVGKLRRFGRVLREQADANSLLWLIVEVRV